VFRHSAGFSDREKGIFVSGKERYFIYSCSKPITVTAAMQLWEEGKFSLEDPLSRYLPEFAQMKVQGEDGVLRDAENPILIEHLFQMAAGFSYNVRSPRLMALREDTDGRCPTLLSMKYLAEEPLGFEPGTRYRYSLCHDVLAALVEKISETEFSQRVKQKIFDPLGMEHSDFLLPPEQWDDVAALYRRNLETNEIVRIPNVVSYRLGPEYASGGAGCVSTVEDYILFGEALLRGEKLLKRDTVRLMTTDRLTDSQRATYWTQETHGLKVLIESVAEEYNVDKDRISLTGVSMGGFGTWNIASANPQYFSAIVPICGGGSPGNARAVGKMPVRLYHGNKDDIVPYEMSVIMSKYLEKNGGNFEFITVEGANHDLAYLYETTDILEWMVDQKKN